MPTAKQIAANRRNAQKSTGPRTTAGKAASRFNSLKHGIFATHEFIFDETAEDLAELTAEYRERYNPSNPEEFFLVETLIANEWRLRRMRRIETHFWAIANVTVQAIHLVNEIPGTDPCSSGDAFAAESANFERLQRVVNSCERAYHKALLALQVARAHGRRTKQPQHSTPGSESLGSFQQNAAPAAQTDSRRAPQPQQPTPTPANLASFQQNPAPAAQTDSRRAPQPQQPTPTPANLASFQQNPAPAAQTDSRRAPQPRQPTPTPANLASFQQNGRVSSPNPKPASQPTPTTHFQLNRIGQDAFEPPAARQRR